MAKILIVEDTEIHQLAARVQLSGHDITVVDDFQEFQKELATEGWDAIITDLNFPKLTNDGAGPAPLGTIVLLLAKEKNIPCVILTDGHGQIINYVLEELGLCYVPSKGDVEKVYAQALIPVDDTTLEIVPFIQSIDNRMERLTEDYDNLDPEVAQSTYEEIWNFVKENGGKYQRNCGVVWTGTVRVKNYARTLSSLGF